MTCQEFLESHSEYLDDCMDPARARRWAQHAAGCRSCGNYDRVLRQGLSLLDELPEVQPSSDFQPRLQHRIYHIEDDARESGRRTYGTGAVASLAVAAALAAVAWSPLLRPRPAVQDVPAFTADASREAEPMWRSLGVAPEPIRLHAGGPSFEGSFFAAPWAGDVVDHAEPAPSRVFMPIDRSGPRFGARSSSGPYSPLMVDKPAVGPVDARVEMDVVAPSRD